MQFFRMSDFDCKCDRKECDAVQMDMETIMKLEGLRREFGEPMIVTSATRCVYHNNKVGGSPESLHLQGRAVDIRSKNGVYMAKLVLIAVKHQFTGIGIHKYFVHLDTRPSPHPIFFGY